MRTITSDVIESAVRDLFIKSNYKLPDSAVCLIKDAYEKETSPLGKSVLKKIEENLDTAIKLDIPICQDTGMAVLFIEYGMEVHIEGEPFEKAVNNGVKKAYSEGYMRCSIVDDPLFLRVNTNDNTPAIIHTRIVEGDSIKITVAPKGFGSENMSKVKMFTPSVTKDDIIEFVVDTVRIAGSNPCPPIMVGVGIGGSFDYVTYLAKKALVRNVDEHNQNKKYAELEAQMLFEINKLNIGPQGFGGDVTALAVNIEYYPTHIAGLPVAVNINCHVMRHAEMII